MAFNKYKKIAQKANGRVFAIGDVHGCLAQLTELLDKIQFDDNKDQVVFVGDLADRGPDNLASIKYVIDKPCFHIVVGNHEELLVESVSDVQGLIDAEMMEYWFSDDGAWTKTVDPQILKMLADKLDSQSYYLAEVETETGVRFGITHAGYNESDWYNPEQNYEELYFRRLVWSRKMAETAVEDYPAVKGIDFTVHGHTIFREPVMKGNAIFIDTGCFHFGKLTALDLGKFARTQDVNSSITCTS